MAVVTFLLLWCPGIASESDIEAYGLEEILRAMGVLPPQAPFAILDGQLVTTTAIAPGSVLLEVPHAIALSKDSAQTTRLLPYLDPEDGALPAGMPHWAALPDEFALELQVMDLARDQNAPDSPHVAPDHLASTSRAIDAAGLQSEANPSVNASEGGTVEDPAHSARLNGVTDATVLWRRWLRLATTQLHGTIHWSGEERLALHGSHALEVTEAFATGLMLREEQLLDPLRAHAPATFGNSAFASDAFALAAHTVLAHTLVPLESRVPVLLPLPQLPIAHRGHAALHSVPSRAVLQLVALRAIPAGVPLSVDAGPFCHADLLLRQGSPGIEPQAALDAVLSAPGLGMRPLRLRTDPTSTLADLKQESHARQTRIPRARNPRAWIPRAWIPRAWIRRARISRAWIPRARISRARISRARIPRARVA